MGVGREGLTAKVCAGEQRTPALDHAGHSRSATLGSFGFDRIAVDRSSLMSRRNKQIFPTPLGRQETEAAGVAGVGSLDVPILSSGALLVFRHAEDCRAVAYRGKLDVHANVSILWMLAHVQ